jgi:putative oxidoreductase
MKASNVKNIVLVHRGTIETDEVVHDAASIQGGVSTRSTNFVPNNPATQSEVDGGASLGSLLANATRGPGLATGVASFPPTNKVMSTPTADVRARFAPYAAIPLRLIVGYGFLAHGLAKWSKGPEVFVSILHATGVPLPHVMAWVTIATEIVCGIAFLIGAFVYLVSIPAIILLGVAIFTVHLPYGFSSIKLVSVNNGRAQFGPPGYECDLLYIACIVALALIGPTPWSVDKYRSLHS